MTRTLVSSLALAMVAATAMNPTIASAQEGGDQWLVLSATAGDGDLARLEVVAESAAGALGTSGARLVDPVSAASGIERSGTRSYRPIPDGLPDRLANAAETILDDVANGRSSRVIAIAEPILSEARPHLEAIGRDERASRNLTDICLFAVRAHLQARRADDAMTQALECLSQAPDLEQPTATMHPPEVVDLVVRARRGLPAHSSLVVEGSPTDPRGCVVRVNGRPIGATPIAERTLPAGRYAVQVDCQPGAPSRVHVVLVDGVEPARVVVDGRFDSTLRVDPARGSIALAYPQSAAMADMLQTDLVTIARATGAPRMLVAIADDGAIWLRAFDVAEDGARMVRSSRVADPGDAERSRAALGSLLGIEVTSGEQEGGAHSLSATTRSDGALVPAIVAYAVGGAALIAFGITAGIATAEYGSARAECGAAGSCSAERVSGITDLALGADLALGVGIAGALVGTILIAVDPPREHQQVSARLEVRGSALFVSGTF